MAPRDPKHPHSSIGDITCATRSETDAHYLIQKRRRGASTGIRPYFEEDDRRIEGCSTFVTWLLVGLVDHSLGPIDIIVLASLRTLERESAEKIHHHAPERRGLEERADALDAQSKQQKQNR